MVPSQKLMLLNCCSPGQNVRMMNWMVIIVMVMIVIISDDGDDMK